MVSLSMALEVYGILKSRRFWRGIPQRGQPKPTKQYSKGLYIRVLVFSICQLFYFVCVTSVPMYVFSFALIGTSQGIRFGFRPPICSNPRYTHYLRSRQ